MGLKTFKNAPTGRVLKSDAKVGKNYLEEEEIQRLERPVTAFFDYIEGIIERRSSFTMQGFAESVDKFLTFNEYRILENFGRIKRSEAEKKAELEYEKFNRTQSIESDFDRAVKMLPKSEQKKAPSR